MDVDCRVTCVTPVMVHLYKTYQESLTSSMASSKNVFISLFPSTIPFMLFLTSDLY